jgi:glycosyltransferase 2 family protein
VKTRGARRSSALALIGIGFGISGAFAYLAVRNVRFGQVWDGLASSNYWWTIPSIALLAASVVLRGIRWRFLFAAETRPPLRPVIEATIIGQLFNNILPARAGEPARIVALNQSARTSRPEAAATVIAERAYDVLALLVLLFVLLPWLPEVTWVRAAAILAAGLAAGLALAIAALALFGDRPFRFALRPLSRLPFVDIERTDRAAASFLRGSVSLRRLRLAVAAAVLTTACWVLLGLSAWTLMIGFDLHLSPLAGMLVIIALGLTSILPASPAGVGVFEAATLAVLRAYGIPKADALSYALVLHAVSFFPYIAAGAVVLHLHVASMRRSVRRT